VLVVPTCIVLIVFNPIREIGEERITLSEAATAMVQSKLKRNVDYYYKDKSYVTLTDESPIDSTASGKSDTLSP
jgi:hypothetical protein